MLSIVGMESTPATDFLVRTLAAALLALTPGAWAARRRNGSSDQRGVLVGLAVYMFVSSIVDLRAFLGDVVGIASIPSIVLRVVVGGALVWLVPRRDVPGGGSWSSRGAPARASLRKPADPGSRRVGDTSACGVKKLSRAP
jgi:hypothetical protein